MSLSLAKNVIVVGADNRPHMLDKINYNSWASRMLLYIKGKPNGKLLVDSVLNGPFQYGAIVEPETETTLTIVRARTYTDLTDEEKLHESVDITATNIVLQGLPQDIYNLVNHNEDAKRIWDRVKLLIQGSELSLQERESKLYDDFDTFTSMLGETIHSYYMRFSQLINDMHTIRMTMKPLQVNTKYPDQIALVANSPSCLNPTQYYPQLSSVSQQSYPSPAPQRSYDAPIVQQLQYQPQVATHSQVVQQQTYQAPALQQSYQAPAIHQPMQPSFPELDSRLVVLSFNPSDDPIASLNKAMVFLSTTFASRFPQTNNQLRTSSNPRNQATIQDERVTVQTVQGRQTQGYANNRARNTATNPGVNRKGAPVQARVVKCYNCQEEGHFARQL
ncbi:transcription factor GTE1-like protein [Tanacetum coccineum]|uniref:Transcription factor GTE1-like protein n=1 Tax=Tanacetum coccineum TaxID=301880 RepID=A0ABQ5EPH2_9ASTR